MHFVKSNAHLLFGLVYNTFKFVFTTSFLIKTKNLWKWIFQKGSSLLLRLILYSFFNTHLLNIYKMYVILECLGTVHYRLITWDSPISKYVCLFKVDWSWNTYHSCISRNSLNSLEIDTLVRLGNKSVSSW